MVSRHVTSPSQNAVNLKGLTLAMQRLPDCATLERAPRNLPVVRRMDPNRLFQVPEFLGGLRNDSDA